MAVYIRREAPGDLPFKQEMWMEYARYLFHVAATGQFFAGYQRRPPWWAVNFADNFGHEAVFV
ncbi:hypothetical protein DFR74_1046 [Nocardia puris]|uniref:Uncharacterized protein n=2 Tax=Nocardia puris TaxID=208602 RepID=A0A366DPV6_9NOCA|nr:hypothetical protein DFR74_1046 [Nocardia puris]